jgi:hypothetical protein
MQRSCSGSWRVSVTPLRDDALPVVVIRARHHAPADTKDCTERRHQEGMAYCAQWLPACCHVHIPAWHSSATSQLQCLELACSWPAPHLLQQLQRYGALPADHRAIVVGRYECSACLLLQRVTCLLPCVHGGGAQRELACSQGARGTASDVTGCRAWASWAVWTSCSSSSRCSCAVAAGAAVQWHRTCSTSGTALAVDAEAGRVWDCSQALGQGRQPMMFSTGCSSSSRHLEVP